MTGYAAKQMVEQFAAMNHTASKILLEHGQHFVGRATVKSNPVTQSWAKSEKPRSRQCYMNAQKFVLEHPEAQYYEGYWSAHIIPVWHGWVVLDGQVIDFTAEACERKLKREKCKSAPAIEQDYFGVHIPTEFIRETIMETKMWSDILSRYFWKQEKAKSAKATCTQGNRGA